MSVDAQALLASIGNFAGKTKLAVEDANTRAVQQTEVLIEEMDDELQRAIPVSYTHLTLPTNREV